MSRSVSSIDELAQIISGYRYRFVTEKDLQDGIETALQMHDITYRRERALSASNRPDFLVAMGEDKLIAIELKIKGSVQALLRQVSRYAGEDSIDAVFVVGTPKWIRQVPGEIANKPLHHVRLIESLI